MNIADCIMDELRETRAFTVYLKESSAKKITVKDVTMCDLTGDWLYFRSSEDDVNERSMFIPTNNIGAIEVHGKTDHCGKPDKTITEVST